MKHRSTLSYGLTDYRFTLWFTQDNIANAVNAVMIIINGIITLANHLNEEYIGTIILE
jgi:hypothetical protein